MNSKRPSRLDLDVPEPLKDLPRFGFSSSVASTREESARTDVLYGIGSLQELQVALTRQSAPAMPLSRPRSRSKS